MNKSPTDAPRQCAYERDGRPVFKVAYPTESLVPDDLRNRPDRTVYHCSYCLRRHVGTAVARGVKKSRAVSSPQELAEILVKARGNVDVAVVAKASGVRLLADSPTKPEVTVAPAGSREPPGETV